MVRRSLPIIVFFALLFLAIAGTCRTANGSQKFLGQGVVLEGQPYDLELSKETIDVYEIAYDNPEMFYYDSIRVMDYPGAEWIVRFTPPQSCSLVSFCIATWNFGISGDVELVMYRGDATGPGAPIISPAPFLAEGIGWQCINLDSPINIGAKDFFLGVRMSSGSPYILFDMTQTASGRSWYRSPVQDWDWWEDLDLHIRAYVTFYNLTDVLEEETALPEIFELHQNYPNPFNSSTVISYTLSAPGEVFLSVYNILGQKVSFQDLGFQHAGVHWIQWDSGNLPSSIYFYRLVTEKWTEEKKMILSK